MPAKKSAKVRGAPAKRPAGASYVCEVRGHTVPLGETCDRAQFCDVDCSGVPMRVRRAPAPVQSLPVRMVGDS